MASPELRDELQRTMGVGYDDVRELGGGGMARIFTATAIDSGGQVAVKVLPPDLAVGVSLERFQREIDVARKLKHAAVVPVLSVGQSGRLLYYTMPLIAGETLRSLMNRERQLSLDQATGIARGIASALDYAHHENIVHRDIKPENILLDHDGNALVSDFGIARAIEQSADVSSITSTGLTLGTPTYMSPEQAVGDKFVDGRSDVYALGCVLYEMLAGEPPFIGRNAKSILAKHLHERPPSLRIVRPDVPVAVQAAVEKALAKTPAERYRTAGAFARALSDSKETALHAPAYEPRSRRRLIGAAIATLALLAMLAIAGPHIARLLAGRADDESFDPRRIAVLEFEDQSPDRSLGHITSGLTVSLIRELTEAAQLHVVSRNGIRTLRDRGAPLDSLVARFGIGSLVEGTVQRSGNQLRVTVHLVDARTSQQLESATIARPVGELFVLEDDLAREVARLLRRRIGVEVRVRETIAGTSSADARELVFRAAKLRDDALSPTADTLALQSAIRMLDRADSLLVAAEAADRRWIAPLIGRGWVSIALAERLGGERRADALTHAIEQADRALTREPANAPALEIRGTALYKQAASLGLNDREFQQKLTGARDDLEHAVRLDSSLAAAWGTLSQVRVALGQITHAATDARTALAMDSYLEDAPTIMQALYGANLMGGETSEAWTWCEQGARDFPADTRFIDCRLTLLAEDDSRAPNPRLAWQLVARSDELEPPGRARMAGRPWHPLYRQMMAAVVSARAGDADSAWAVARRAKAWTLHSADLRTDFEYEEAYLHLVLGDRAEAIRLLESYLTARPSLRDLVARHPRWRSLRGDSAFTAVLQASASRR